ncbi:MAG TPA: metallophosphoesterase [Methylosinus sp.]|jgi:3',5'-cyclic AMP phosphodiesterase CpdA|uniref:metallophosphoesterase family protein n=1 Tax=Methylosinus sp. TaxID=427 RepID=UPI002F95796E
MIDDLHSPDRRRALKCMAWGGSGVLWTLVGGVPASKLVGAAHGETTKGFSFVQISDTHIGFDKAANNDVTGTLNEALAKIGGLSERPAFLLHTGDITHLSKPKEFDDADQLIGASRLAVHRVPGEHDVLDERTGEAYRARYGNGTRGDGWYSFDAGGAHFIGLVNVLRLEGAGLGRLGVEQISWLAADLAARSASTPIVIFAHMPLWSIASEWGWGTQDSAQALQLLTRFGSVTILNGHIHQIAQKVEGNLVFHTARSTAFPQPEPGTAKAPGPKVVPAEQLRSFLGLTSVTIRGGAHRLAIADATLAR